MPNYEPWKLDAAEAPWGHDGYPSVREGARGRPRDAIVTAIFVLALGGFVYLVATDFSETAKLSSRDAIALVAVISPPLWWLSMFAQIRGWLSPVEFGE